MMLAKICLSSSRSLGHVMLKITSLKLVEKYGDSGPDSKPVVRAIRCTRWFLKGSVNLNQCCV